jgi:lipopolysaccharide transport system ATP-binding protein
MFSDVAISVRGLSKAYIINHDGLKRPSFREVVVDKIRHPLRKCSQETFWALNDVSFDVKKGDVVGIIGRNGAGKSTLLKVLSRIVEPTKGEVDIYGRVGSLLEVGTGFHPELTGRENIYLNGAILGMKRREIKKQFDAIVDFAEVERFLDTPVKRYSSGMYVRLAFAVAAHLNPEILVIDEVLAVGDANFQKKCLGRMGEVAKQGRTVLFVSHNMTAVQALCSSGITFEQGRISFTGSAHGAISRYFSTLGADGNLPARLWKDATGYPGNDRIRIRSVRIASDDGQPDTPVQVGKPFYIKCEYWNLVGGSPIVLNPVIYALDGTPICEFFSVHASTTCDTSGVGLYESICRIPADFLNEGQYRLRIDFHDSTPQKLFSLAEALNFSVTDLSTREMNWYGQLLGYIRPRFAWETTLLAAGVPSPSALADSTS